jgi:hypothetical protein
MRLTNKVSQIVLKEGLLKIIDPAIQYSGNFSGCGKLRVVVVLRNEEVKN